MPDTIHDVVLVGGGLASAKAAEALRDHGYEQRLTIVAEEPHRPYERPALSKQVLMGTADADTTFVHAPDFYDDHDIALITGDPAMAMDRQAATVTLDSGTVLPFDRLLLATGARARRLRLTDRPLSGIHTLRTRDDALRLHDELVAAGHVTIVGAGWIGCEVAAAARTLGVDVTLVDPLDAPLQRVVGTQVGSAIADLHRSHGVDLRLGTVVDRAHGTGRVEAVSLRDGTRLDTDLVVVGIGTEPRTELGRQGGLEVRDGIVTDATLATRDPRILAAGDVASTHHPRYRTHLRVEHWANALHQGVTAGANLLGAEQPYERLPYFFSDQYDLGLEYVGHARDWHRVVLRGDTDTGQFMAFWLDHDRVTAAMHANTWDVIDDLKALVGRPGPVDPRRLADPTAALADLAAG